MSLFEFCLEIIKKEGLKFNVGVNTDTASQITAATASDVNYDVAQNRCSFMYRCGAINLTFAKDCFKKFLDDERNLLYLLIKWANCKDLTICSVSKGPALDYIALLLAYQECGIFPSLFKNVKVVSKHGAWRNSVNIMFEILKGGFLKSLPPSFSFGNVEVIQGDPFTEFTEKVRKVICNSEIILMVKVLHLSAVECDPKLPQMLQDLLGTLKPGAVLFCIDTKPSISLMTSQLTAFDGNFLFEPTHMNTSINVGNADFYKNIFGCFPVISARGSFFVWQKSSTASTLNTDCLVNEVPESVKSLKLNNVQNFLNKLPTDKYAEQDIASTSTSSCASNNIFNRDKMIQILKSTSINHRSSCNGTTEDKSSADIVSTTWSPRIAACLKNGSSNNGLPVFNQEETFDTSVSYNSVNQSIQAEPEDIDKNDFNEITELNNRIAEQIKKLQEVVSELDECKNDNSFSNFETESKYSISNECDQKLCCSPKPTLHRNLSESQENCNTACKCSQRKVFEDCCHDHICQKDNLSSNEYKSCASFMDHLESCKHGTSCCNKLNLPNENSSVSTPSLVIPVNSLPPTALAQILSIIAQSKEEK